MSKGRPREFNIDDALSKATIVFWEKGYRGASLDDLTEAMEINRPSLYAAFGDKEKLFVAVIDHYKQKYMVPAVIRLLKSDDLRSGLLTFFRDIGEIVAGKDGTPPGCLIACMLNEEVCQSAIIRQKLADAIAGADAAFGNVFEKHCHQLRSNLTAAAAAKLMTTTVHGLSTRARVGAPNTDMMQVVEAFVDSVCKPSCPEDGGPR